MNILPKKSPWTKFFLLTKNIIKNIVDYGEVNSNNIVIEIDQELEIYLRKLLEKPKNFMQ